jgi:hypothetical protein
MRIFDELGTAIESAWRDADYDDRALPAIAARALREAALPDRVTRQDVTRWLLGSDAIPQQEDVAATFAEPPVTVYHGRRVQIQVLFWVDGSTSVHAHGFVGAFQLLDGPTFQCRYAFRPRRRISARFVLGDVTLVAAEVLERGQVVEIDRDLIHATFHLEAPSATVVVRSYGEPHPTFTYHEPSIAMHPFYEEPIVTRWLQALSLLMRTRDPDYERCAAELLDRSDMHTAYRVLEHAYRRLDDLQRVAPLLEAARRRHGAAAEDLIAALDDQRRRQKLFSLRTVAQDQGARFFLAVMMSLRGRSAIFAAIEARYPGEDPRAKVIAWARALSGVDRIGVDLDDDLHGILFEALLDGIAEPELFERLETVFDAADVEAQAPEIRAAAARMRRTALASLFPA